MSSRSSFAVSLMMFRICLVIVTANNNQHHNNIPPTVDRPLNRNASSSQKQPYDLRTNQASNKTRGKPKGKE
jgi:hypothetical protein